MALESYKLSKSISSSNPRHEMYNRKKHQIKYLYDLAMDRVDDAMLNGKCFVKSPRIFYEKNRDSFHYRVTVEVIEKEDYFIPGDYLEFNNETWLCLESKDFHGLYCSGTFQKCNWLLKWQDKNTGEICEYWCIDENATQYNSGEMTNKSMVFKVGSVQHVLTLPYDERTVLIESPMRFFLDRNPINPTAYRVTQNDNTPYNYNGKGLCRITVMQDEMDNSTDRPDLGVCDYVDPEFFYKPQGQYKTEIVSSGVKIKSGGSSKIFSARFTNENANSENITPVWDITCDFEDRLNIEKTNSEIKISVDDDSLIGSSFILILSDQNNIYPKISKEIFIEGLFS